ncbi:MAG: hypothetical protein ACLVKE_14200 [Clostridium baratii]
MKYVDECLKLDIDEVLSLKGDRFIFKSSELKGSILTIKDSGISINDTFIRIEKYKNKFGEKNLFLCPYCLSPRKHIYYVNGGWKCRECGELKYRSTNTYRDGMDYCDLKIDKILDKLKLEHNINYYTGDSIASNISKPKYMRWNTYYKLIKELMYWQEERNNRWLNLVNLKMGK